MHSVLFCLIKKRSVEPFACVFDQTYLLQVSRENLGQFWLSTDGTVVSRLEDITEDLDRRRP